MSLPEYLIAREGDACVCGRIASRMHCPICGSFRLRFMPSLSRDAFNPQGSLGVTSVGVKRFFRCDICSHMLEDSEYHASKNRCEAPLYESKSQKAVAEILRAKRAAVNNEPLTHREEIIARRLEKSPTLNQQVTKIVESEKELVPFGLSDQVTRFRREWANMRLSSNPSSESVDEFIQRRMTEEGLS